MKIGTITLNKKIESAGFVGPSATETAPKDARLVNLYLGTVTAGSVPHFSADGALMALGYGPVALTRVQDGLVRALKATKTFLDVTPGLDDTLKLEQQVEDALALAENFSKSAGPLIDPVLEDAARFRFSTAAAMNPAGAEALTCNLVDDEMGSREDLDPQREQERFVQLIDEARRRLAAAR